MKVVRNILIGLILIVFGFWLSASNVLVSTSVGNVFDSVMAYLPVTNRYYENPEVDISTPDQEVVTMPADQFSDIDTEVDLEIVQEEIVRLTNELRTQEGLDPLTENPLLHQAGQVRAEETSEVFSHTRPDGREPFTVFDDGIPYDYSTVGENLAMATYFENEVEMAKLQFQGWMESPGHYENMMSPQFEEIGVGVYYDGEILYTTQMFGTPR